MAAGRARDALCALLLALSARPGACSAAGALAPATVTAGGTASVAAHGCTPGAAASAALADGAAASATVAGDGTATVLLAVPVDAPPGRAELSVRCGAQLDAAANVTVAAPQGAGESAAALVVETDQLVYKPGATVRVRALLAEAAAAGAPPLPTSGNVTLAVRDPSGFVIARWTDLAADEHGVVEVEMPTSAEPVLGEWTVAATADDGVAAASRAFTLEKYVLPTFEVTVSTPRAYVVQDDAELVGSVRAEYTYGEPVARGSVSLVVWQEASYYGCWDCPVVAEDVVPGPGGGTAGGQRYTLLATKELRLADGEATFSIPLSQTGISFYGQGVVVEAEVRDAATGESQNGTSVLVTSSASVAVELDGYDTFAPGATYRLEVRATQPDGSPSDRRSVPVVGELETVGYERKATYSQDVALVDGRGSLEVAVPSEDGSCCTPEDRETNAWSREGCCLRSLRFRVDGLQNVYASKYATAVLSPSRSLVVLRPDRRGAVSVGDNATYLVDAMGGASGQELSWAVMTPLGSAAVGVAPAGASTVSFAVTSAMAGGAWLVAYAEVGTELVSASAPVDVAESGLELDVDVAFEQQSVYPGGSVRMHVNATAGSRTWIQAVDRSVELLGGGSSGLTTADVLDAVRGGPIEEDEGAAYVDMSCAQKVSLTLAGVVYLGDATPPACTRSSRFNLGGGGVAFDGEVAEMEMAMDDAMMADAAGGAAGAMPAAAPTTDTRSNVADTDSGGLTKVTRVRQFFPETWIWTSLDVGDSGSAASVDVAPDTITSWSLRAWATHPTAGVGIAVPSVPLTVFKPFFVQPVLPYSAVRGEVLNLKVVVYNYEDSELEVTVTVEATGAALDRTTAAVTVQPQATVSTTFSVTPERLGSVSLLVTGQTPASDGFADAVRKDLLVEAEGVRRQDVENRFLSLSADDGSEEVVFSVSLPADTVEGSARATLSVTGDLMAQTLANLDQLLVMPTGCGEQNMLTLAPNVFVAAYLSAVGRTVPEKARRNTLTGYQRELTYRHPDGSFSAFGVSDGEGSLWLTAFVVKTFAQARDLIYVDPAVMSESMGFVVGQQAADGSFWDSGRVIHTEMTGGVSSKATLAAYCLVSLLEADLEQSYPSAVTRAAAFVAGQLQAGTTDTYKLVLTAYALSLACARRSVECAAAAEAISALEAAAVTDGSLVHWDPAGSSPETQTASARSSYHAVATAGAVETTGYGLLALATAGKLGDAFPVAKWLLQQRGALGAYRSTQDTVVALQALAEYAAAVYSTDVALDMTAVDGDGVAHSIALDASNFDVLQIVDVAPGADVTVTVNGRGNALLQVATAFNTPSDAAEPEILVRVEWSNVTGTGGAVMEAQACAQAESAEASAAMGMVMMEVGLFTGYQVSTSHLDEVQASSQGWVRRFETADRKVSLYLDRVPVEELCVRLIASRVHVVEGLQPVQLETFSYYQPHRRGSAQMAASDAGERPQSEAPAVTVGGAEPDEPPSDPPDDDDGSQGTPFTPPAGALAVWAAAMLTGPWAAAFSTA